MRGRVGVGGENRLGVWRGHFGVYAGIVVLLGTLAVWGSAALMEQVLLQAEQFIQADAARAVAPAKSAEATRIITSGAQTLTQDDWVERLRSKDYWNGRGSSGNGPSAPFVSRPAQAAPRVIPISRGEPSDAARYHDGEETTYRTVCVRLCDGYFWPVSFATTNEQFKRDRATCERGCGSPSRLYVYKNPGEEPEEMRDVDGQPYSKLKTAFLFRTKYEANCKCSAHPWEQEAQDRHRVYALEAARQKGNKAATQELVALRTRMEADKRQAQIKKAAGPQVVSSATIVAGVSTAIVEPDRSTERLASPVVVVPPPVAPAPKTSAARPATSRTASREPAYAPTMRLGSGRSGGSSSGRSSGSSSSSSGSRGGSNWQRDVFRGN